MPLPEDFIDRARESMAYAKQARRPDEARPVEVQRDPQREGDPLPGPPPKEPRPREFVEMPPGPAPQTLRRPVAPAHTETRQVGREPGSPSRTVSNGVSPAGGRKADGKPSGGQDTRGGVVTVEPAYEVRVGIDVDLSLTENRVTPRELALMTLEQMFGLARDEADRMKKVEGIDWRSAEGRKPTDAEFQQGFVSNITVNQELYDRMTRERPYLGRAMEIERLVEQGAHAWVFELLRERDVSDFLPSLPDGVVKRFNALLRRASRTLSSPQLDTFNQNEDGEGLIDDVKALWDEVRNVLSSSGNDNTPGMAERVLTPWTGKMQGREVVKQLKDVIASGHANNVLRWLDMPALLWHLAAYDPQSAVEVGFTIPLTPEAREEWLDIIADYAIASWRDHGATKADILIAPIFDRLRLDYMDKVLVRIAARSKVQEMFKEIPASVTGPGSTTMPITMAIIKGRGLALSSYNDVAEGLRQGAVGTVRGLRDAFIPIVPFVFQGDYATEIEGLPEQYRALARQAQAQELREMTKQRPQDIVLGPGYKLVEGLYNQGKEGVENLAEGNYETGMQKTTPVVVTIIEGLAGARAAVSGRTAAREAEAGATIGTVGAVETTETALVRIGQTARAAETSEGFLQAIIRNRSDGEALWAKLSSRSQEEIAQVAAYARGDRKVAMFLYQEGEDAFDAILRTSGDVELARAFVVDPIGEEAGLRRVAEIRASYDHRSPPGVPRIKIDKGSNVAYARYNIDGASEELIGVSGERNRPGTANIPSKRRYETSEVHGYDRAHDAEVKILEEIATRLRPDSRGTIELFSEIPFCESCNGVIKQFEAEFINVKVIRSNGPARMNSGN